MKSAANETKTMHRGSRRAWAVGAWLIAACVTALSLEAGATVRREGEWPATDKSVSMELKGVSRSEALRKLAEAAGWSVVVPAGLSETVDLSVKAQPADKLLDLLLADGEFVAKRDGTLVHIAQVRGAAAPQSGLSAAAPSVQGAPGAADPMDAFGGVPAVPPIAPLPPMQPLGPLPPVPPGATVQRSASGQIRIQKGSRRDDRFVAGSNLTIGAAEEVGDITVFSGTLDLYGHARGDVTVIGGTMRVHDGARIDGDANVVGGAMHLDDGAEVVGDVSSVGGSVHRGDKAKIGGSINSTGPGRGSRMDDDEDDDEASADLSKPPAPLTLRQRVTHAAGHVSSSVTAASLLFILGAVLIALSGGRMETLRVEMAARPMRTFAVGIVGAVASIVLLVALCITLVGIPVALVAVLALVLAGYAGVCAALQLGGEMLVRHKTENAYIHLAVGCALFMLLGMLPWFGGVTKFIVAALGFGAIVATRAAGLLPQRSALPPATPPAEGYRTAV